MSRFFVYLGIGLALLAGIVAATVALAYGTEPARSGEFEIAGLSGPVRVAWGDSGAVVVEATTEADLAAGLGVAHATDHAWAMSLWRQAANGALGEWIGDEGRVSDLHARALGLRSLARQTYASLPEAQREVLDAYARGATRVLLSPSVAQSNAFLAAGVTPEPWRPWDALAVERLHAYLASPPLDAGGAVADSAVAAFLTADSTFRAFLAVRTESGGRVYAATGGAEPALVTQAAAGGSALPLLAPAVLRVGSRSAVAATIPGTLVSPAGWAEGTAWGMLLGSDARLERYAGPAPPPVYSRIVGRGGTETLVEVARDTAGVVLRAGRDARPDTAATPPDDGVAVDPATNLAAADSAGTGWRVRWRGFRVGTDLGAFAALRAGRAPGAFALLDRAGLTATRAEARVLGAPPVTSAGAGYAFVAGDSLARYAAARLAGLLGARPDSLALVPETADSLGLSASVRLRDPVATAAPPEPGGARLTARAVAEDAVSPWAARLNARLLAAMGDRDSLGTALQVPYSYLKSWDGAYTARAIAPSIFERWLLAHRDYTGHLPDPADSLDAALLPYTLRIARAELRDRHGTRPIGWRWGTLQGDGPRYPVLGERDGIAARSYRDVLPAPGGHPTTLAPGPSLVFEGAHPARAVWTVWTGLRDGRMWLRSPTGRATIDDVVGDDAEGVVVALDPEAATPSRSLRLVPAR